MECIVRLQLPPPLPHTSVLSFPIRADSFVLFDHKPSLCTTTALFCVSTPNSFGGTSSYSSSEHLFFFSWFFVSFVVFFHAFFSRLVEVLLRWGFGIYQYYVSYWNNGGLYQKNELFCMKILAKPYFPSPPSMSRLEHLLSFKRE